MARFYWLVNLNRSRVKRFIELQITRSNFQIYFIDAGKVTSTWDKELPVLITRKELKKDLAREEWENLSAQGSRRAEEDQKKKKAQTANP